MANKRAHLFFEKIYAIAELSEKGKELLMTTAIKKKLLSKEILLNEGQLCQHIFFVEKGYLRTFYNKDGKEINLAFTLENNFTTNLQSLRSNTPSEYVIQAGEATLVWQLNRQQLLDLYKESTEINQFGRNLLEHLLADQEEQTHIFRLKSPTERYQYLVHHHPLLMQKISLSQLSSYLGISRETLSRIRGKS